MTLWNNIKGYSLFLILIKSSSLTNMGTPAARPAYSLESPYPSESSLVIERGVKWMNSSENALSEWGWSLIFLPEKATVQLSPRWICATAGCRGWQPVRFLVSAVVQRTGNWTDRNRSSSKGGGFLMSSAMVFGLCQVLLFNRPQYLIVYAKMPAGSSV